MQTSHTTTVDRLSTVIDSFLETARAEGLLSGESPRKYRQALMTFIKVMGDLPIQDITLETFVNLKRQLLQTGSGPSHINGVVYAVKRLLHYCHRHRGLSTCDLSEIRPLRVPRRAVTYLTSDELDQFMSAIRIQYRSGQPDRHGLCFRTLVEVLAATGMRISEALSLDRTAMDSRDHEAKIVGKGGKERTVFFSERAMRWLRRYCDSRTDRDAALFLSARSGRRLERHEAQRMCHICAKRSGITKRVTLHTLRHTFATTLLRNGCPIGHIQGLLGHERLETTCRYYLGVLDNKELKKAHERFLDW